MAHKYLARELIEGLWYRLAPSSKTPRPTAKKAHPCSLCGKTIGIGEPYWNGSIYLDSGYRSFLKLHDICGNLDCKQQVINEINKDECRAREIFEDNAPKDYSRAATHAARNKSRNRARPPLGKKPRGSYVALPHDDEPVPPLPKVERHGHGMFGEIKEVDPRDEQMVRMQEQIDGLIAALSEKKI